MMRSQSLFQVIVENKTPGGTLDQQNMQNPLKPSHVKTGSALTTKEQSTISQNQFRNKSFFSDSNKVSERKEEDEESSQKTKPPKLNFKSKKLLELCEDFDEIIEETEVPPSKQSK